MIDNFADWMLRRPLVSGLLATVLALGITYLLALAGEPRSVWIFRDILGVLA